ncbi:MAG TPA: CcdB family protein [Steroidobacteraceae bacterium]|nr:CcdB family protein [Steroidobacteraceae bacterium]
MAQFDVYVNPVPAGRRAYPFVVAMQSDITLDTKEQIVAPLAPRASMREVFGHLTPRVDVHGSEYIALVTRLNAIRSRDLAPSIGSVASARRDLLAAIDYLFFGV